MTEDSIIINGEEIKIIARETALMEGNPIAAVNGRKIPSVDRILLADERVMFLCVHPADRSCGFTSFTIPGVTSHQRTHSGKMVARRAAAEIEAANERAAAAEQELTQRKTRASERAKTAAATRNANRAKPASEPQEQSKALTQAINRVTITANAVDDALEAHRGAVLNLIKITNDIPACDPQIAAKAKQYDILKSALHGI